jgi:hypothetical protein
VRPRRKSQIFYSPCPPFSFLQCFCEPALFRSQEHIRNRSEMYLCLYIHAPNSSRSEDSPFGPASGMTSDRFEQFFILVSCKHHKYFSDRNEMCLFDFIPLSCKPGLILSFLKYILIQVLLFRKMGLRDQLQYQKAY